MDIVRKGVRKGYCLKVRGADAVTLLLTGASNFSLYSPGYVGETKEQLHERVSQLMRQASVRDYGTLKSRHLADYRPLFERVKPLLWAGLPEVPTDELVRSHVESLYLDMLYFQYGRYLMLASSRGSSPCPGGPGHVGVEGRLGDGLEPCVEDAAGNEVEVRRSGDGMYEVNTARGGRYSLWFMSPLAN